VLHSRAALEAFGELLRRVDMAGCGSTVSVKEASRECRHLLSTGLPVFRHPLGFFHLELTDVVKPSESYDRVRVHFFPSGYREAGYTPSIAHSHRWYLKSCVVASELVNIRYAFLPMTDGPLIEGHVDYHAEDEDQLIVGGRKGDLQVESTTLVGAGMIYCQETEVLHATETTSDVVDTLVLAKNTVQKAKVVIPIGAEVQASRRKVASNAEIDGLSAVLERVCG
jgi:hypothetical protein